MHSNKMDSTTSNCDECGINICDDDLTSLFVEKNHKTPTDKPVFICEECKKEFVKKSILKRHIENFHLPKSKPNVSGMQEGKVFKCEENGCTFATKHSNNLKRHIVKMHLNPKPKPTKTMFQCLHCEKKFAHMRNLRFHERKIHNFGGLVVEIKRQCPLCPYISSGHDKKEMYSHFEVYHNISLEWHFLQFATMAEFISWKIETEKLSQSSFVRSYCTPSILNFQCHRSGAYRKKGFDKRRIKRGGSCKINAFCPAGITVKLIENNTVSIGYLATHVGHEKDLIHLSRLKNSSREDSSTLSLEDTHGKKKRRLKRNNHSGKTTANNGISRESSTKIEMEKLMMEVQEDMDDGSNQAIFLDDVTDVQPTTVGCINITDAVVECQITVLTNLETGAVIRCIDLQEEKNKFLDNFIKCINESVQSLEDLEYVKQHCQAILPNLRDSIPVDPSLIT